MGTGESGTPEPAVLTSSMLRSSVWPASWSLPEGSSCSDPGEGWGAWESGREIEAIGWRNAHSCTGLSPGGGKAGDGGPPRHLEQWFSEWTMLPWPQNHLGEQDPGLPAPPTPAGSQVLGAGPGLCWHFSLLHTEAYEPHPVRSRGAAAVIGFGNLFHPQACPTDCQPLF